MSYFTLPDWLRKKRCIYTVNKQDMISISWHCVSIYQHTIEIKGPENRMIETTH